MKFRKKLLWDILSQPSSPFREGHVIATLKAAFDEGRVPYFQDPCGNIVVGAKNREAYGQLLTQNTKEPLRLFIAHMDHPGFHGEKFAKNGNLEVRWHGWTPTAQLTGASVWLSDRGKWRGRGKIVKALLHAKEKRIEGAIVKIADKKAPPASEIFGGFGFRAPVWQQGKIAYTKAADDLVGCFALASLALDWFSKNRKAPPFLALLTRAEEVGFIGTLGHLDLGWHLHAKRPLLCVSLETSRTLPGADIGKGPVVRLGDRFTVFDAGALRLFTDLAEKKIPGQYQRRIMDGGSCEASAATVYGIPSIGISVPLGNYHNQNFQGGPDSIGKPGSCAPAPEFVHLDDVQGLISLCHALLTPKLAWHSPWLDKKSALRKSLAQYRPLLRSSP